MRVDIHAHYYPTEYTDRLIELGDASPGMIIKYAPGGKVSLEERIKLLDEAGIDMQVLSAAPLFSYFQSVEDAVAAARLGNDLYADICRRYHGRFGAFAAVPLPHVPEAIAEVGRCLDTLGMLGVTVGCSISGRPVDDPAFEPFFAELDRRRAVLFLHPMGTGGGPHTAEYGLNWMVGAPFEDTIVALRLVMSGLTARHPNVRIVVPHLGGTLPLLFQRLDDSIDRQRHAGLPISFEGKLSSHLRRLWYDTVNSHPAALRCACDSFGADRLVLGTDFPFLAGPSFLRCVSYIEEAPLSASERTAIFEGNAKVLLGL